MVHNVLVCKPLLAFRHEERSFQYFHQDGKETSSHKKVKGQKNKDLWHGSFNYFFCFLNWAAGVNKTEIPSFLPHSTDTSI